ncbi:hypothetical protein NC652_030168 [Populus alba x Populus x berolinensis]|nr:hypothetical protein NC652_030168 [Populus alba x Populus x berolinensis]
MARSLCSCVIETGEDENESEGSDLECSDALDLSKVTEMRLVFCECAELNPEPITRKNIIGSLVPINWQMKLLKTEDSELNFSQIQQVQLLQINDHRFEDAEEMEHEHESEGRH